MLIKETEIRFGRRAQTNFLYWGWNFIMQKKLLPNSTEEWEYAWIVDPEPRIICTFASFAISVRSYTTTTL